MIVNDKKNIFLLRLLLLGLFCRCWLFPQVAGTDVNQVYWGCDGAPSIIIRKRVCCRLCRSQSLGISTGENSGPGGGKILLGSEADGHTVCEAIKNIEKVRLEN